MQNLAKKILKLTELVRSLEFDLEHREEEQDALLQKLDEQMKKNKNITMKKDKMLLELENDIKKKEEALQNLKNELLHKDDEKYDLVDILNNQIAKNSNIIGELQDLRQKYKLQDKLENEIQSQEDALMELESEMSDSENVITGVENALDNDDFQDYNGNESIGDQSSDVSEFNHRLENIFVLQSRIGGWSSSYEPRKYNSKSIHISAAVTHDVGQRPKRYPTDHYHSFSVSNSWFKSFFLLKC